MPALRNSQLINDLSAFEFQGLVQNKSRREPVIKPTAPAVDLADCDMAFPTTSDTRAAFRTAAGKRVPPHHWAVYDLVRRVPAGKVTTYKDVCGALRTGSPRSVGAALRNNPFAPRVPCHRVVAADLCVGGFKGEWVGAGKGESKTERPGVNWHEKYKGRGMGAVQREKVRMLGMEGVVFDERGRLVGGEEFVWRVEDFASSMASVLPNTCI